MPPKGFRAITIDDETFELLTEVMVKYDCDSVAEAIEKSANIALEKDEAELAQNLAELLND
jgi:hypothetical protein